MPIFKTDRPNATKYILTKLGFSICIVLTLIICDSYFKLKLFNDSFYFIMSGMYLMQFFDEIMKDRYYEVNINIEKQIIILYFKTYYSKINHKIVSFDDARIEIIKTKANKFLLRKESIKLYFLKNKTEISELENNKDGFSIESLEAISNTLKQISLATINL